MSLSLKSIQNHRATRQFWITLSKVSVRTKIMGIVLGIVLLLGLTITFQTRASMRQTLTDELEERGSSIAGELAARSTDLVLTSNLFALSELLQNSLVHHDEVRYAFAVDAEDRLLAHSFGDGFPPDLLAANSVGSGERYKPGNSRYGGGSNLGFCGTYSGGPSRNPAPRDE